VVAGKVVAGPAISLVTPAMIAPLVIISHIATAYRPVTRIFRDETLSKK
jgi:hypothetical protein